MKFSFLCCGAALALAVKVTALAAPSHNAGTRSTSAPTRTHPAPPPRRSFRLNPSRQQRRWSRGGSYGAGVPLKRPVVFPNVVFEIVPQPNDEDECPVLVQILEEQVQSEANEDVVYKGEAPLMWLARRFHLVERSSSKAVWEGALFDEYQGCHAYGYVNSRDGKQVARGHSRFAIQLLGDHMRFTVSAPKNSVRGRLLKAIVADSGRPQWIREN